MRFCAAFVLVFFRLDARLPSRALGTHTYMRAYSSLNQHISAITYCGISVLTGDFSLAILQACSGDLLDAQTILVSLDTLHRSGRVRQESPHLTCDRLFNDAIHVV